MARWQKEIRIESASHDNAVTLDPERKLGARCATATSSSSSYSFLLLLACEVDSILDDGQKCKQKYMCRRDQRWHGSYRKPELYSTDTLQVCYYSKTAGGRRIMGRG